MMRERDTLISAAENCAMFDRIARRYDAMNRLISLGMDRRWRRKAVADLEPVRGGKYLDVGTGTGDLAFEILDQVADAQVVGIDPAEQMLAIARSKAARRGVEAFVRFEAGDALALAADAGTFDGIVSGFCFRNIERRQAALEEMFRGLKSGGRLVILEAVCPESWMIRAGYWPYMRMVALAGRLMVGGSAYRYLMDSITDFPKKEAVIEMFKAAGFCQVRCRSLALGTVCVFSGRK